MDYFCHVHYLWYNPEVTVCAFQNKIRAFPELKTTVAPADVVNVGSAPRRLQPQNVA